MLGALAVTALDAALLALALGGIGPCLHHARALSLLGAWAVGGMVLALLRPVRTHEPIDSRAESPLTLLALFVIPLITPPIAAASERMGFGTLPGGTALRWAGVLISAAGLAIRVAAMATLGSRFSPRIAIQRQHPLETRGLYAWVRHPGYLGAWLTTLGAAMAFGSGPALALVALMWMILELRMGREEALLEQHFGDEYRRYRERSARFLPWRWPRSRP